MKIKFEKNVRSIGFNNTNLSKKRTAYNKIICLITISAPDRSKRLYHPIQV